ncbi:MAG: sensor histidine kinase [Chloroflexi bacterium]|nr:sensor histidine kinase [Chloroflexota bacterium]
MAFIREFFELNRDIILFIYGLVFFVLGLGIALQSRRYSRLDLARSLSWLAAFGFTHSFNEWGDLFIPIQRTYLSEPVVQMLNVVQLLLLAVSFTCLFEFGVALLRPLGRARWLHGVPAGLLLAWVFSIFFIFLPFAADLLSWHHMANAIARYFIGFPAGLLAAYGLRQQTFQRIAPLNVPHIVNTLRVAGVALVLYAIFGGLISPPVPFFPGNFLNAANFEQAFGVPPLVFRSLIGLTLAIAIIRALEVFEVETARIIERMEQQQILAAERERIGRELHDGAIQTVYTAGLLVESAHKLVPADGPAAVRLEKAVAVLNDAIGDLRRNLGELHAAPSGELLPVALHRLAEDPRFRSLVDISLNLDLADADSLSPVRTDHVLAIAGEALSNVVRHAQARRVRISAQTTDSRLTIRIQDDGRGIMGDWQAGYGLRNMRDRARLLGGQLEVTSANGKGTTIILDIPWKDER